MLLNRINAAMPWKASGVALAGLGGPAAVAAGAVTLSGVPSADAGAAGILGSKF